MHPVYLNSIKSFEGFTQQATWDYAQHSNGYGTKALYPGEKISSDEAERRFAAEIAEARRIVDKYTDGWDEGTKAALTSLTFNAGSRWINSGLGAAVRAHDVEAVRTRFVEYNKAQGQVLPGLVTRRLAEVDWIGQAAPAAAGTKITQAQPAQPTATIRDAAATTTPTASPARVADNTAELTYSLVTYRSAPPFAASEIEDSLFRSLAMQSLIETLFNLQLYSMRSKDRLA
jgi:lysozyme